MKQIAFILALVLIVIPTACGKNGIGKITAPKLGDEGQWVSTSGPAILGIGGVTAFAFGGTIKSMFALSATGVWRSTNNGVNWVKVGNGLADRELFTLASKGTSLFVGTDRGVYRSSDNGASWQLVFLGAYLNNPDGSVWQDGREFHVTALVVSGTTIYAGGNKFGIDIYQDDARVFRSTDNGETWTEIFGASGTYQGSAYTSIWYPKSKVTSLAVSGTSLYVGIADEGVYLDPSTQLNNGLTSTNARALVTYSGTTFVGTDAGVSRYEGGTWVPSGNPGVVYAFAVIGADLYAATDVGVFHYTGGSGWESKSSGLNGGSAVLSLVADGSTLFAGIAGGGEYRSADNGARWTALNAGALGSSKVYALAVSGTTLLAGTDGGVYRSADDGANWEPAINGLPANFRVLALAVSNTSVFAGGEGGVFRSDNNGGSWTPLNLVDPRGFGSAPFVVSSLAVRGPQTVFVGSNQCGQDVWRSLDNGGTWKDVSRDNAGGSLLPASPYTCVAVNGANDVFAAAAFICGSVFRVSLSGTRSRSEIRETSAVGLPTERSVPWSRSRVQRLKFERFAAVPASATAPRRRSESSWKA